MARKDLLWRFWTKGERQNGVFLAPWAVREMFTGGYVSASGMRTALPGIARSGRVTDDFFRALLRAAQISRMEGDCYGYNSRYGICRYTDSDRFERSVGSGDAVTVIYDSRTGEVYAKCDGGEYDVRERTSAPVFLSMWGMFLTDDSFCRVFMDFIRTDDREKLQSLSCLLADIAYSLTRGGQPEPRFPVKDLGKVRRFEEFEGDEYVPDIIIGRLDDAASFMGNKNERKDKGKADLPDAQSVQGKYRFSDRKLTERQKQLVPVLDDSYVIGKTLLSICSHIKETTGKKRPVRNILLRGAPGTGKSRMYVGIAALCGLPLYTFAANSDTETFDIFGQFLPADRDETETGSLFRGLPSPEDMSADPVMAYEEITGRYDRNATVMDCMSAAFMKASANASRTGQRIRFVEGPLVKAMRNGGVLGLDEVNLPVKNGVLPALNPAMDDSASILLPTGERVKRHPDTIFVSTMNCDLEGTRNINQAWASRCQLTVDMGDPDEEELTARIKGATGWVDSEHPGMDFSRFLAAYSRMREIVSKKHLTDGDLGPRQLEYWINSTMVTGDPVYSASITIVPSATARERGQRELMEKIHDLFG